MRQTCPPERRSTLGIARCNHLALRFFAARFFIVRFGLASDIETDSITTPSLSFFVATLLFVLFAASTLLLRPPQPPPRLDVVGLALLKQLVHLLSRLADLHIARKWLFAVGAEVGVVQGIGSIASESDEFTNLVLLIESLELFEPVQFGAIHFRYGESDL